MLFWIYALALIAIGLAWRRSARDAPGYFLAGRSLAAWQMGLAMAATAFGGSAILLTSQYVYLRGLAGVWFSLAVALGFGVLGCGFAARIRAGGAHSLAGYIGRHYGEAAHWIASVLLIVVELGFFGLTVKSFAILARPLLPAGAAGVSDVWLQGGICAVFVSYTLLGGHKADVMADIARLGVIGVALLGVLLPVTLWRAPWGELPAGHWHFPFNPATHTGPLFVLNMLVLMGLPSIVGGDVFAKVLSARDGRAAQRGMLLAFAVRGALALAVALLALGARAVLPGLAAPEQAVPLLAKAVLSPLLFQLVALALFSALLSTSDSVLITMSAVLTLDILRLGERAPMWASRLATLLVAGAGLSLALYFQGLLNIIRFSYTLLAAGLAAPIALALLFPQRRVRPGWFIGALLTGVAGALLWRALGGTAHTGLDPATAGAAGAAGVMGLGLWRAGRDY